MTWVEETLRHDSFLDDLFDKVFRRFKDKDGNYWWQDFNPSVKKVDLYKITFEKGLLVKDTKGYKPPTNSTEGMVCITRHVIFRRWDNEYLGFAQSTGAFKVKTADLSTDKVTLLQQFVDMYKGFVDYTTIYSYTMDTYSGYTHSVTSGGAVAPVTVMADDSGVGVLRASLDIEYHNENTYHEGMKQSPIIAIRLKGDTGEGVGSIGKLNFRTNTNWWDDSLIRLQGTFNETSCYFTLKIDSAPMWEDNMVVTVPFFFGNLVSNTATKPNLTPIAMFGGTQVGKFFDFDNIESNTETIQPVTRNYVNHPSNGVDSVMVKKTKYGARYQAHYLSWNVPPNVMPPTREELRLVKDSMGTDKEEEFKRKYPRAWNYLRFGYYNYNFQPSRYDQKAHSSRAYVVHPEDGTVGYIPSIVLLPAINILDGDRLKYSYYCAECPEQPYVPTAPTGSTKAVWSPEPSNNMANPTVISDGGSVAAPINPTVADNRFTFFCDSSVDINTIDSNYWEPSSITQDFMVNNSDGLGRPISTEFWQGRNDWLEFLNKGASQYHLENSLLQITDFNKLLWKSLQDVINGNLVVSESWEDFRLLDIGCLTDLQKASLFMTAKLKKPVTFFTGSEGFLNGGILDNMIPLITKVPNEVYDWADFNNVFIENQGDQGVVGAWSMDEVITATMSDGTSQNILSTLRSFVNFEPQVLRYPISAAKAHRPYDYIKPSIGFGTQGSPYSSYFLPEMTDTNYLPFVASEVAIHEMGHALSDYGYDQLVTKLHDMSDWLSISGWVRKTDGSFDELTKSVPGVTLDNGKLAPVSDYGCFDPAEDFAESFMMYVVNKQFLFDKFKAKHDFIYNKLQELGINPNL